MSTGSRTSPGACLFELSGDRPGSAHGLHQDVFRIGSDSENDLVLKDPSVALYQVEIHSLEHGHLLKNLSSHGSAFLNGEPFEEALLQKGDILTLGDSMIRYVSGGEALTQEELWRPIGGRQVAGGPRRLPLLRILALALLTVAAIGTVVFVMVRQPREKGIGVAAGGSRLDQEVKAVDRQLLQTLYARSVAYLSARRWDEALVVFDQLRLEAPSYKDVDQLYQQALRESVNTDALALGKGLYGERQWAEAAEKLRAIPKDSLFSRETEQLLREIDAQTTAMRVEKAREFLARSEWLAARQEAEAVLAKFPDHQEATSILNEAKRMLVRVKQTWYLAGREAGVPETVTGGGSSGGVSPPRVLARAEPSETKRPSPEAAVSKPPPAAGPLSKPAPPAPPKGTPEWNLMMALTAYRKGDVDQSLRHLEPLLKGPPDQRLGRQAREMSQNLQNAMSYYQQANTLQNANRTLEALEMWEKFLEKDRRITGSPGGSLFERASASLGRIYCQRGQKEFASGDLVKASRFWNMAGRVNPQDEEVKRGLRQLSESARKFYREGYSLQEINPARAIEIWKVVLQIVPPDHPYHQEARRQINRYTENP